MNSLLSLLFSICIWLSSTPQISSDKPFQNKIYLDITEKELGSNFDNYLKIEIGTPPQKIKVKLTTNFCGWYVYDERLTDYTGFKYSESSSFNNIHTKSNVGRNKGYICSDYVKILNYSVPQLAFLLVNEARKPKVQGALGLGFNCLPDLTSPKYTVDVIDKIIKNFSSHPNPSPSLNIYNLFTLTLHKDRSGIMNIINYPEEIENLSSIFYYKRTPIISQKNNRQWSTKWYSVYFSDNAIVYTSNTYISIGISGRFISVNKKVFDFIVLHFFIDAIDIHKTCEIVKGEVHEIYCNNDFDIDIIGYIALVISTFNVKIKAEDLFYEVERKGVFKKWFAVVYYPERDEFYIAQKMMNNVMIVYNKEKQEIGMIDWNL